LLCSTDNVLLEARWNRLCIAEKLKQRARDEIAGMHLRKERAISTHETNSLLDAVFFKRASKFLNRDSTL
jgi:hypothetical protein